MKKTADERSKSEPNWTSVSQICDTLKERHQKSGYEQQGQVKFLCGYTDWSSWMYRVWMTQIPGFLKFKGNPCVPKLWHFPSAITISGSLLRTMRHHTSLDSTCSPVDIMNCICMHASLTLLASSPALSWLKASLLELLSDHMRSFAAVLTSGWQAAQCVVQVNFFRWHQLLIKYWWQAGASAG